MSTTTPRSDYLIGSRPINHETCTQGWSGTWYPNFGNGIEVFGWEHDHDHLPTPEPAVREDGHSVGCIGTGVLGFDTTTDKKGQSRITRYHYCRIPVRQHYTTTNTEGPTCP